MPQLVASSSGAPPSKRRHHSSESQEDVAEIGTCLGENQCNCGQFFEDRKSLDVHIIAVNFPSYWSCPHQSCSKFGHPTPVDIHSENTLELTILTHGIISARNTTLGVKKVGIIGNTWMNTMASEVI